MSILNSISREDFAKEACWYAAACPYGSECNHKNVFCDRYFNMCHQAAFSGIYSVKRFLIPLRPQKMDVPAFKRLDAIRKDILNWIRSENNNLCICSANCGNGKTTWSAKIMLKLFDQLYEKYSFMQHPYAFFINVPEFISKFKITELREEYDFWYRFKKLADVPLVVWDDIGSSALTKSDFLHITPILEQRLGKGLANIFTTNVVSKEAMEAVTGPLIASRVWSSSEIVEFKGQDRRDHTLFPNSKGGAK